ncbi:hypothetical protein PF004_g7714 [Phytophthora fragariae]|uniref:Uncharacterized protein n=2 Tax=Phytophthora TaxID=4783 RepID=A0A6A3F862_9STRA|nr:hypothetical protein PF003_g36839 [Phytophthora fragariae]KAE8940611.1 hypothetical protein PF009_g9582 [Phytophthora fragariae]KAE9005386.1 hypothetical protein PF011_g12067 [Phytophthora fragariae]KAE9017482.1 hypothetical protein PR002_g13373 [Phytophthora rubi]KAE9239967.1 hypothetical protein PF004_g7714 [Phytophthora fragariae]
MPSAGFCANAALLRRDRALSFFLASSHLLVQAHIGLSRCNAGCGVIHIVSGCTSNILANARAVDVFDWSLSTSLFIVLQEFVTAPLFGCTVKTRWGTSRP